ncbi:MAG: hypothetical protein HUJ59_05610 [Bacilli bacterium]|nr:hypothetical protein [Bacilli bacterium]
MGKKLLFGLCIFVLLVMAGSVFFSYYLKIDYAYIPYPNLDDSVLFSFDEVVSNNLPIESCYQKYLDYYFDPSMDSYLHISSKKNCKWGNSKLILSEDGYTKIIVDDYRDSVIKLNEKTNLEKKIVVQKSDDVITGVSYRVTENQGKNIYNFYTLYLYDEKNLKEICYIDSTLNELVVPQKIFLKKTFENNDSLKREAYRTYFAEADFLPIFLDDINIPWKIYEKKATPVIGVLEWGKQNKEDLFFECDNYVNCKKFSSVYENVCLKNSLDSICDSKGQKNRKQIKTMTRENDFFNQKIMQRFFDSTLVYERYEIEQNGFWRHKRVVEIAYDSITGIAVSRLCRKKMSLLGILDIELDELKETNTYQNSYFLKKEIFQNDSLVKRVLFEVDSLNEYSAINVYGPDGNLVEKFEIKNFSL